MASTSFAAVVYGVQDVKKPRPAECCKWRLHGACRCSWIFRTRTESEHLQARLQAYVYCKRMCKHPSSLRGRRISLGSTDTLSLAACLASCEVPPFARKVEKLNRENPPAFLHPFYFLHSAAPRNSFKFHKCDQSPDYLSHILSQDWWCCMRCQGRTAIGWCLVRDVDRHRSTLQTREIFPVFITILCVPWTCAFRVPPVSS